jgi:hypothetical protein
MTIPIIITESAAYLLTMLIGTVIAVLEWETITDFFKCLIKRLPIKYKSLIICIVVTVALSVLLLWIAGFLTGSENDNGQIDIHLQKCIVTLYFILLIVLLALFHSRKLETVKRFYKKLKISIFLFLLLVLYSSSVLGIISCEMWDWTVDVSRVSQYGIYGMQYNPYIDAAVYPQLDVDYFFKMTKPVEIKYSYSPDDDVWAAIFGVLGAIVALCIGIILWKFQLTRGETGRIYFILYIILLVAIGIFCLLRFLFI